MFAEFDYVINFDSLDLRSNFLCVFDNYLFIYFKISKLGGKLELFEEFVVLGFMRLFAYRYLCIRLAHTAILLTEFFVEFYVIKYIVIKFSFACLTPT